MRKKTNTSIILFHLYLWFIISNDKEHPILEYGVDSAKAKSISLDVLNKGNSQLVMGRRGEEKEREEKTIVKDVKKVVKEEEMAVLKEVARMEQIPEVKKSAGGLYPDLSLLTDTWLRLEDKKVPFCFWMWNLPSLWAKSDFDQYYSIF